MLRISIITEHSEKKRRMTSRGTNGGCFEVGAVVVVVVVVLDDEEDGATEAAARAVLAS